MDNERQKLVKSKKSVHHKRDEGQKTPSPKKSVHHK